mmetsp:Transcript_18088/g.40116  ORF Transcript_18088/g.40116 Transcript_18088/m.40116 type:complete len:309 (+) Transcript_18088:3-929(+)
MACSQCKISKHQANATATMLTTITKKLPSLVAAQLRSPSAYPSLSLAARRTADQIQVAFATRSKSSTAPMATHDETSQYDSFYLHPYDDEVPHIEHDLEELAERNARRLAKEKGRGFSGGGLLSPCGAIRPEKFFLEDPIVASRVPPTRYDDMAKPPPHSDLCHLEDPYHKYEYQPHLTLLSSDLLSELDAGDADDSIAVSHCSPPKYKIVQEDASGTTIEVDVAKYNHEDVSAEIENGQLLHVHARSSCWAGHDTATNELEAFDMKLDVGPGIIQDGVTAKLKDGILTIHVPREQREVTKVKNIPIV